MRTKRVVIACLVEESCDGYQIVSTDSVGFFIKKEYLPKGIVPKPGDIIDLMLEYGCEIVGIRLNGTLLFLKSEEEVAKEREKKLAEDKKRRQEVFERQKDELDARFASFPKLLQHRIELFRMFDPNFRRDEEDYEMSAMYVGYRLYLADTRDITNVRESMFLSGNQVSFALMFANAIKVDAQKMDINNPASDDLFNSMVMMMPNAMSPLSGSRCMPRKKCIRTYIGNTTLKLNS